jgi:hypothetical protein
MGLTAPEINGIIADRLAAAGLTPILSKEQGQFFSFSEGFFVELALRDANRLSEVEAVVQSIREELRERGIKLEAIVRPIWKVLSVNYVDASRTPNGTLRAALQFKARLEAGSREAEVIVNVSIAALDILRKKLGKRNSLLTFGWTPEQGDVDESTISQVVRSFLEESLSTGGTGYWDPTRYPSQELGEVAMSSLLGESRAFVDLRRAIDRALGPQSQDNFFKDLASRQAKIKKFEDVLPDLSNFLGGAFRPGETLPTSSSELFSRLRQAEQKLLRHYYLKKVDVMLSRLPQLGQNFPNLF